MNNIKLPESVAQGKVLELNAKNEIVNSQINTTEVANAVSANKKIYYITEEAISDWESASNEEKTKVQNIINDIIQNLDNPKNYPIVYLVFMNSSGDKLQAKSGTQLYINATYAKRSTNPYITFTDCNKPETNTGNYNSLIIISEKFYTYKINLTSSTDATILNTTDPDYKTNSDLASSYSIPVLSTEEATTPPSTVDYLPTQDQQAVNKKYVDQQDNLILEKVTTLENNFNNVNGKLDDILGDNTSTIPPLPDEGDPDNPSGTGSGSTDLETEDGTIIGGGSTTTPTKPTTQS